MRAVFYKNGHLQRRVEFLEHLAGDIHTCQYTFFLDYKALFALLVCRNGTKSGMVAVTNVFGNR